MDASYIFDSQKQGTIPEVRLVDTTVDTVGGERSETVLKTYCPLILALVKREKHYVVEIGSLNDDHVRIYDDVLTFSPEREIGRNQVVRRELKLIPDKTKPDIAFVIRDYVLMSRNVYGNIGVTNLFLQDRGGSCFVENMNTVLSLSHGRKAFSDISRLTEEEYDYIRRTVEMQARGDWFITSPEVKSEQVDPAVLEEIKSVFDALSDDEKSIVGMNELKIIKG